jgi:hypothetical protein
MRACAMPSVKVSGIAETTKAKSCQDFAILRRQHFRALLTNLWGVPLTQMRFLRFVCSEGRTLR